MTIHRMSFPAPRRACIQTERGWMSRPYTLQDIVDVFQYGGYFLRGCHEFAPRLGQIAYDGPAKLEANLAKLEAAAEEVI